MKLSIIIVNYKTPELLKNSILSINENPPSSEYEIIVVDNNSKDGSEKVSELPFVTYIALPENRGFSYANNKGFSVSKGEYILFLNPDTIMHKGTLDNCLSELKGDTGCVGCRLLLEDGSLDYACRRSFPTLKNSFFKFTGLDRLFKTPFFSGYNLLYLPCDEQYFVECIVGAFMMMPREVFIKIGGFDEQFFMYGEDVDLCLKIKNEGYKIFYDGKSTVLHKKRASSKKSAAAKKAFYDSMWIYYKKHHAKSHTAISNALVRLSIKLLQIIKG